MKIKNQKLWNEILEKNQDAYGKCICSYAEKWANLMERKLEKGKELKAIANKTSHTADTEGITGFMYGCAVSMLSTIWEHGEELRKWHNIDTQIGNEGEKANETGDVLNPALLNIGKK